MLHLQGYWWHEYDIYSIFFSLYSDLIITYIITNCRYIVWRSHLRCIYYKSTLTPKNGFNFMVVNYQVECWMRGRNTILQPHDILIRFVIENQPLSTSNRSCSIIQDNLFPSILVLDKFCYLTSDLSRHYDLATILRWFGYQIIMYQ